MSQYTSSYDELPYEDIAYYHTHPRNLAVVATLCGLNPPSMKKCRVLELGCGSGFNLLAMAHSLPDAQFVGIDLSNRQIEQGQELNAKLQIDRIKLVVQDVADLDSSFGQFDYIIGHGLFSWVPPASREAILALCKRHLAPNGIAYLSYNTYPGWHTRSVLRDLLRFHASPGLPLLEQARQARKGVEQFFNILSAQNNLYTKSLQAEIEGIRKTSDIYIAHEFLESNNQPFRFEEFARMANGHGLRYLAETRFETNTFAQSPQVQKMLGTFSRDLIRREQYHDDLRNRTFRQSLLCHAQVVPPWSPSFQTFGDLRVYCRVEPQGMVDDEGKQAEKFRINGHNSIVTTTPLLRVLLHCLHDAWPRMTSCQELTAAVISKLSADDFTPGIRPELQVAQAILTGYTDQLWLLFADEPPYATTVGEAPEACPLARHLAGKTCDVTNRLHRPVKLTELERKVLHSLDGQKSRDQLTAELSLEVEHLEKTLRHLAESALLVR